MSPRPRLDDASLGEILDATVDVIGHRGVDRTRLTDIARAVGRSTGTLQHYFPSREALLIAAFHRLNQASGAQAQRIAEEIDDPWERVRALIGLAIDDESGREEWKVWVEFWSACSRDDQLLEETAQVYGVWRAPIRAAVEEGVATGRFRPRASAAEVVATLLAVIDGIALHVLLGLQRLDEDAAAQAVIRLAAADLGVRGEEVE